MPGQLAFDAAGNLYVAGYQDVSGTITSNISIYAPGATAPTAVLQPPSGSNVDDMAVSESGYLAVLENETSAGAKVVIYSPAATVIPSTTSTGLQYPRQITFGE